MWPMRRLLKIESHSIRGRLLRHMGLVFAFGMLALYWAASTYAEFAADNSYDRLLLGSATSIAETLSIVQDQVSVDIPYAALDMLTAAPNDKVYYQVSGPNGALVTGYQDVPLARDIIGSPLADGNTRFFDATYKGEPVRFVVLGREVRMGGKTDWIRVQVGQTREARSALATELTLRALVPIIMLTALAGLIVWITVGRAVRPLERIGRSLTERKPSDLSPIDESEVPAEVVPLVTSMNQFMERLDGNIGLLRTFIANVAHQLRTPLTAMMVELRLAESGANASARSSLRTASQSGERLARLVDQLLGDALVMHRSDELRFASFDLRKAVEQALEVRSPTAWDSDVRFTSSLQSAMLVGDEAMCTEAVKNLIHNALTHGDSPDGVIEITLTESLGGYCLRVSDSGPGIAADVLEAVGSRFKTGNSSRGGAGLGLAIVKQVVESHNGRLTLSNRPKGGALAEMWLPVK